MNRVALPPSPSTSRRCSAPLAAAFALVLAFLHLPARAAEPVVLQLKWLHAFQFAGYYVAEQQGFYREAGLDVRIVEAVPGENPLQKVLSGKGQYGTGDSSLLLRWHEGKPVVVLGVVFQHSAMSLVALQKDKAQSIHDLADKRLMLTSNDDELRAYLNRVGLPATRYKAVANSFNINDLIEGRTDAFSAYVTDQTYTLDRANIPYVAFSPRSAGIDFYGDNLYATRTELEKHPQRARAFLAASMRGWVYAMEHPEATADLILERYSKRRDRDSLLYEAQQMVPLLQPVLVEMGYMSPGRWHHIADAYADLDMLPRNLKFDSFLFDPDPVRDLTWLYRIFATTFLALLLAGSIAWKFFRMARTLRHQKQFLDAIVENEPECVKVVDAQGRLSRMNRAGLEMLEVASTQEAEQRGLKNFVEPEFRKSFAELHESVCQGRPGQLTFQIRGSRGTVRWLETHAAPLRAEASASISMLAVTRDITARKQAEAELAKLHSQLLEMSRKAGMSEVASNVLHNVGNVLNSVNVSATVIEDRAKRSKIASLEKLALLLEENRPGLGEFMEHNPKGQQIPGYMRQLATYFQQEQTCQIQELQLLRKNIEHIKQVVAMQQNYAKVSGVTEPTQLADLIDDTLRISSPAVDGARSIKIVRDIARISPVAVDKHKVLQILVNLVSNARHACEESGHDHPELSLRLVNGDHSVKIMVADNGIGIAPENLNRIFNHGFTTKKSGHGFGLHSSANAAREMGGSLRAHSDGPGQGAAFVLELPVTPSASPICQQN